MPLRPAGDVRRLLLGHRCLLDVEARVHVPARSGAGVLEEVGPFRRDTGRWFYVGPLPFGQ